jgi:hypothetical protein
MQFLRESGTYIALEYLRKSFIICPQFFYVLFVSFYLCVILSDDQEPDPSPVGIRISNNLFLSQRTVVLFSVADPGSGAFLTLNPGSGIVLFRISDPKPIFLIN